MPRLAGQDREVQANIIDLVEQFVDAISTKTDVDAEWNAFMTVQKADDRDPISGETKVFIDNAFRDGAIPITGMAITKILPPVSRFNKSSVHAAKEQMVRDRLDTFYERYFYLI